MTAADLNIPDATRTPCDHCGRSGGDFVYHDHNFCCECMNALTAWLLSGVLTDPDVFSWLFEVEASR